MLLARVAFGMQINDCTYFLTIYSLLPQSSSLDIVSSGLNKYLPLIYQLLTMTKMEQDAEGYFKIWKPEHAKTDQEELAKNIEVFQVSSSFFKWQASY
jgi:hypothetical protein